MLLALAFLAGCTQYDLNPTQDPATGPDDTAIAQDTAPPEDTAPPGGATEFLYAQTGTTLYAVDPSTYALTEIGRFSLRDGSDPPSITDLAVDGEGRMFAVSTWQTFEVDPQTVRLTPLARHDGDFTVALSFLADGTLIAGGDSTMWRVDTTTGALSWPTDVPAWAFSGDMVSLPDGYLYCAMGEPSQQTGDSSLVVLDGTDVMSTRPTGVGALFGVGWAQDKLFGFSHEGDIYTIDPHTGRATRVASPGLPFGGAATNPWRWSN